MNLWEGDYLYLHLQYRLEHVQGATLFIFTNRTVFNETELANAFVQDRGIYPINLHGFPQLGNALKDLS